MRFFKVFFKKECYKKFFLFFYNYSFFTTNQPPLGSPVESRPFEVFGDLLCHHAHLAVFMNYVISNSDPSALVCQKNLHKNCRNYSDNILFSSSFSIWLLLPTKREAWRKCNDGHMRFSQLTWFQRLLCHSKILNIRLLKTLTGKKKWDCTSTS